VFGAAFVIVAVTVGVGFGVTETVTVGVGVGVTVTRVAVGAGRNGRELQAARLNAARSVGANFQLWRFMPTPPRS
jgi:hypothetical protein